jgi:hypothetical protein
LVLLNLPWLKRKANGTPLRSIAKCSVSTIIHPHLLCNAYSQYHASAGKFEYHCHHLLDDCQHHASTGKFEYHHLQLDSYPVQLIPRAKRAQLLIIHEGGCVGGWEVICLPAAIQQQRHSWPYIVFDTFINGMNFLGDALSSIPQVIQFYDTQSNKLDGLQGCS